MQDILLVLIIILFFLSTYGLVVLFNSMME